MTLPYERTRSVIQAAEFLRELSRDSALPEGIRNEAKRLLRHYPDADLVLGVGRFEEFLAASAPQDPKREVVIHLHEAVFSSDVSGQPA